MPDIFVSDTSEMNMAAASDQSETNELKKVNLRESSHAIPSEEELKKFPGHTRNPLASYSYYPKHVSFSHADEQEKIILFTRKHPITNIPWLIIAFLMLFAPLSLEAVPLLSFLPLNFQTIAILIWYLITIAFVFEQFLTWYFNVNIITDERIFDVDFDNLLYRKITDADLDQIQDVTVRIGSAIRTVFNYGDVLIQTAAEVPEIEFHAVPYPDQIAKIIRDLRVEEEVEKIEGRVR